jgi:glycosyltransferase involved in cell wall biosynthesis
MTHVKISIITATLNEVNNLEKFIKSVIPHISNEVEFIIIDGKSTDGTVNIIKQYLKFLYYWESSSDSGIYEAFNKGIKVARGEFLSFVGSDDILLEDYSKIYLNAIYNNPRFNYFSSKAILNNKKVGRNFDWRELRKGMKAVHSGSLHKKSLFNDYGFYNTSLKIASDYDFLVRCGSSLNNFFINEPTIIIGANGISNSNYLLTLREEYQIKSNNNFNNFFLNMFSFYYAIIKKKILNIFKNVF